MRDFGYIILFTSNIKQCEAIGIIRAPTIATQRLLRPFDQSEIFHSTSPSDRNPSESPLPRRIWKTAKSWSFITLLFVFNTNPTSVLHHPHTRSGRRLHELKLSRSHCQKSSSQETSSLPHLLTRHHMAGSRLLAAPASTIITNQHV